ncbi:hypothetical protein DF19_20715 [Streptomyces olindensis]|nr:hypothetical protein DF19_20715 [Streptomyces olindensis]
MTSFEADNRARWFNIPLPDEGGQLGVRAGSRAAINPSTTSRTSAASVFQRTGDTVDEPLPLDRSVGELLRSRRRGKQFDRAVAPLGLTHTQYALVASLYGMQRKGACGADRGPDDGRTR